MRAPDPRPVVLVLGAKVRPDGSASPALRHRALEGARLVTAGLARHLIASGGILHPGTPSEAALIARLAQEAGVPPARITRDEAARTTEENLRHAKALLPDLGGGPLLIVTDGWHAPRVRLLARALGLAATVHVVPRPVPPHRRMLTLLREAAALLRTALRIAAGRVGH
jgi:uncharacterized SAM-binding protein YcdF (DUF218 family)